MLDAVSGEPIPWSDVTLTRDAVRQVGRRQATDTEGLFRIPDIETGAYPLRVERLGYASQYVPVSHLVPPDPIEVRLDPDSAVMAGLAAMTLELRQRQAASGHSSMVFGEERLRFAHSSSMRDFLRYETSILLSAGDCAQSRGIVSICLYVDEVPVTDAPWQVHLHQYNPQDFYRVEVFKCPARILSVRDQALGRLPPAPVPVIYAYTYEYMERMAGRPTIVPPVKCD